MTFNIALTGINAASTDLEVISNNVANSATTGFKQSRAEFADIFSANGGATATGSGVRLSNVRQDFGQGDVNFTDSNLDLAVDGLGLLNVSDEGKSLYTRAGAFGLDREGYIVNAASQNLLGYGIDSSGAIQPVTAPLRIDYADLAPKPSSEVRLVMNLDAKAEVPPAFDVVDADTYNFSTSTTIYDSLGTAQIATSYLRKDAPNLWSSYLFVDGVEVSQPGGDELAFDASGNLVSVNGTPDGRITSATFTPQSGAEDMAVSYDLTTTSQFEGAFGVNSVTQDGFAAGRLDDFDIDTDGMIFARYSNGQAKLMGQVVLSNFPNAPGLKQVGNTAWEQTSASGAPATGAPGSASLGLIQAGALENSNVDITKELVKMIGAQRNFQASAQVISTSDTITQTIINIRR